ncbi:hypothetical protein [Cryptosporangium sp. NPDC051539]|uniref:hypothetical protein n=1 Tax=Cryptosporangium sp. NPDC051539 TaxID=3363962 RepID=UPI00379E487B
MMHGSAPHHDPPAFDLEGGDIRGYDEGAIPEPDPELLLNAPFSSLVASEAQLSHRAYAVRSGHPYASRLTAEDFLYLMALRTAISRALNWGSQADVRDAREVGADWSAIATARGVTVDRAQAEFVHWIDAQAALWDSGPTPSGVRFGFSLSERASVRSLVRPPCSSMPA